MKCRISKAHVQVYRAVEGAVINTAHGHPRWHLTPTMAASIAKRATGTLTAQWPDVLAARSTPSYADDPCYGGHWPPRRAQSRRLAGERLVPARRRSPLLRKLHDKIGNWAGSARRQRDYMKVQVLVEILREIDRLERGNV